MKYLTDFVETLGNPVLQQNLEELQQTVGLMQAENSDEYYDVATRNKKYGRVDAMNGPLLLEKSVATKTSDSHLLISLQVNTYSTKPHQSRQIHNLIL